MEENIKTIEFKGNNCCVSNELSIYSSKKDIFGLRY